MRAGCDGGRRTRVHSGRAVLLAGGESVLRLSRGSRNETQRGDAVSASARGVRRKASFGGECTCACARASAFLVGFRADGEG